MWVIDTSALVRMFVPDGPLHPLAEQAFNQARTGADVVMAPQLLLVEVANVLVRKSRRGELTPREVQEILNDVMALPVRYFGHEALLLPACGLAQEHQLSAYDALYLALAQQHGARLLTCDDDLHKAGLAQGLA